MAILSQPLHLPLRVKDSFHDYLEEVKNVIFPVPSWMRKQIFSKLWKDLTPGSHPVLSQWTLFKGKKDPEKPSDIEEGNDQSPPPELQASILKDQDSKDVGNDSMVVSYKDTFKVTFGGINTRD